MSNILTFKNGQSYFTIEDVGSSSIAFMALKSWATKHCNMKESSKNEFLILNDNINQTRLRGCRIVAMKQNLKVSIITPLEIAI